jgi:ribosomal protein S1
MGWCISAISRGGRVNHPEELYKIGDKVQVVVLDYDPETGAG